VLAGGVALRRLSETGAELLHAGVEAVHRSTSARGVSSSSGVGGDIDGGGGAGGDRSGSGMEWQEVAGKGVDVALIRGGVSDVLPVDSVAVDVDVAGDVHPIVG